jgi:two-component system, cell cycle sensor histidine kinase and response regulator CckA
VPKGESVGESSSVNAWPRDPDLRSLFDHVPGAVFRCDLEPPWRMREVSEGVLALTGRPAADFRQGLVNWADIVVAEDLEWLVSAGPQASPLGYESSVEYRIVHLDGTIRWIHDNARVIVGSDGVPCLAGVILDVTAARQSEAALRETAAQLRAAFDRSPVGAALVNPDTTFVKVNEAFSRFVGYTDDELRGTSFAAITHPEHRDRDLEQVKRLALGEIDRYEVDKRYIRKDGTVVWGRASVGLVREGDGRPKYFLPIIQDITTRKQAEQDLLASDARYRIAFHTSPDSININRASDGLYLEVNEGFLERTGWAADEVIGRTSLDLDIWVNPEERDRLVDSLRRDGACKNLEALFRMKDGSTIVGLMSARVIEYRGEPCILSVTRDITEWRRSERERHELEQQLQQSQKLESLGVLAGGIAHDFNNILMAVLGHAELALDDLSPLSGARGSVSEIVTAARRAGELCRQMLAYSGRASFAVERVDLAELVDELLHLLKTSISKKAVLNVQIEKGLPAIQADPSQIRQVVMNLVLNASEALGDQTGVIALSASAAMCDGVTLRGIGPGPAPVEGMYVRLEVADTGCGMSPEVQTRIFEPFYTTKFSGRGLGLAALLGIVRAHHGAIKVASEPGKGSVFTVFLPALADAPAADADTARVSQPVWHGSGTVLFADDEESLRTLGARMLERLGYRVLTAADGREAVETYRRRQDEIDLVILDLTMPLLDGGQAIAELRAFDPEVRVVLASGYTPEDVSSRLGGLALTGVLQKPYTLSRMRDLLSSLPS